MTTAKELAALLERTVAAEVVHLRAVPDGPGTRRPNRPSGKGWSMREELGHLIDSAVNNHGRFARAALSPSFEGPDYEQDGWVAVHRYDEIPWPMLVETWHSLNSILVPLVAALPDGKLATPCAIGGGEPVTLGFLVEDYVLHMRHHLDQILRERGRDVPN